MNKATQQEFRYHYEAVLASIRHLKILLAIENSKADLAAQMKHKGKL